MSNHLPKKLSTSALAIALAFATVSIAQAGVQPAVWTFGVLRSDVKPAQTQKKTLKQTIDQAIASSALIDVARRQVQLDAVKISQAGAPLQPTLDFSASETRFDKPTVIQFGTASVTALHDHLEIIQAQLTETLDLLGHVRDARSQARLQQAADIASYEAQKLNKAVEAKNKYLNVLRSSRQVQVAEAALNQAQVQESIAKKLYEGQVGQKVDYLRAQSNTAEAQQNLTAARNNLDVAKANFNNLIGVPLSTPVELEDVPGVSVGADIEQSGVVGSDPTTVKPDFKLFSAPLDQISKTSIDTVISQAQVRRPEILQATALVRASQVGIRIAHQSIEPTFAISLTGDKYPTTSLSYPRSNVGALAISANFPILDGGVARDEVQQASIRLEQDKTRLEKSKTDISLEVKTDYLNLLTAAKQLESANANLKTAIAARQLAEVRYSSQVGIFLEISDAQAALVRAEADQVDAVYSYFNALATYEAGIGLPIASQTNTLSSISDSFPTGPTTVAPSNAPANTQANASAKPAH